MFDDHLPHNSGQVPANLPMGEPEDMFNAVPSEASPISDPVSIQSLPGENLASQIPPLVSRSAVGAGVLKPKQTRVQNQVADIFDSKSTDDPELSPSSPGYTPSYPQTPDQDIRMTTPPQDMMGAQGQNQMYAVTEPIGKKRIVMWVAILLIFGILGFGSLWIYFSFIRKVDPVDEFNVPNKQVEQSPEQNEVLINPENTNTLQDNVDMQDEFDLKSQILLGEPLDTDGDGLTDVREAELKTSPLIWDTDSDELGDYEEVTIWKTDPLEADTDSDGYSDNEEIENGYNPKGSGKLFQPPTSTTSTL